MKVIDLMYKELAWNRRILEAGGELENKRKKKKCWYGTVGLLCYLIGVASIILFSIILSGL